MFDFPTLFTVTTFFSTVAGLLLVFAWLQNRTVAALGMWGTAYLMGACAMSMVDIRAGIPDGWPVLFANVLWTSAHGLMWTAARNFEGRRTPLPLTFAGAAIFIIACQFEAFDSWPQARIALSSAIVSIYLYLGALEFWRARDRQLMSRWPAIVLLTVHGTVFLARILLVNILPFPVGMGPPLANWFPFGIFELLLHIFCMSVLLVAMAKERAELRQRQNALIDPLTGVANRRAFFDDGDVLLRRARAEGHAAALLLFDLDRFKQVNDTFGHQAGDRVLSKFCDVAKAMLRPGDLFGRFGGEEFACMLDDTSLAEALRVAERIRLAFASVLLEIGTTRTGVTVSVGVAISNEVASGLDPLFAAADDALYRAKAKGRNRVESAQATRLVVGNPSAAAN
jgi:diguanylate cyclase (GGDEF)-like protein